MCTRIVEVKAGEIDGDEFRDVVGRNHHVHIVQHHIDRAAALDAGRGIVIAEMDRDRDLELRAGLEAQEIDMHRRIAHDVELVVARNGAFLLAIDVDLENRGEEVARVDQLVNFAVGERNRRRRFAAAIDDGWNFAFTTYAAGGPLAGPAANRGGEGLDLGHGFYPFLRNAPTPPGVSETSAKPGL